MLVELVTYKTISPFSSCGNPISNYMVFNDTYGLYTHTFEAEKKVRFVLIITLIMIIIIIIMITMAPLFKQGTHFSLVIISKRLVSM